MNYCNPCKSLNVVRRQVDALIVCSKRYESRAILERAGGRIDSERYPQHEASADVQPTPREANPRTIKLTVTSEHNLNIGLCGNIDPPRARSPLARCVFSEKLF